MLLCWYEFAGTNIHTFPLLFSHILTYISLIFGRYSSTLPWILSALHGVKHDTENEEGSCPIEKKPNSGLFSVFTILILFKRSMAIFNRGSTSRLIPQALRGITAVFPEPHPGSLDANGRISLNMTTDVLLPRCWVVSRATLPLCRVLFQWGIGPWFHSKKHLTIIVGGLDILNQGRLSVVPRSLWYFLMTDYISFDRLIVIVYTYRLPVYYKCIYTYIVFDYI